MNNNFENRPPLTDEEKTALLQKRAVERRKKQLKNNLPLYIIFGAAIFVVIFTVTTLVIIMNFNKNDPAKKLSDDDYIFKIGTTNEEIAYNEANRNGILYINMNEFAKVCQLTGSGDSEHLRFTSSNGQYVRFTKDSNIALINSYSIEMTAPADIENNICYIPLDFLKSVTVGISIEVDNVLNIITINRDEADGSTNDNPLYIPLSFLAKTNSSLPPLVLFTAALDDYEVYMNPSDSTAFLLLVNKTHPLGEIYTPSDLCTVDISYCTKDIEMSRYAAMALEAMMIEMHTCGYTNILVTSGYRSYEYQKQIFDGYIADEKSDPDNSALTDDEITALVSKYSARAGESEHQSGLCADLINKDTMLLDESFANNPAYEWLTENAWKFGFIERYPEDKTETTGYNYEPWHYRYVGREAAYTIYSKGLCLEEYLELKNQ